ncbi:MAG: methyltransferase [Pseudomonadota bacterium]
MPHPPHQDLTAWFHGLRDLLAAQQGLWRPAPFHEPRPAWCAVHPALAGHLLALDDATVARLASDNPALIDLLAGFVPDLRGLRALVDVPVLEGHAIAPPERLLAHVPGRKQAQIRAFAEAVGETAHPLLEWCAGKGHLGRLLAWRQPHPVTSLELVPELVEAGVDLARRGGLAQNFVLADALAPDSAEHLAGRHALALHACGDLHLALLRGAVARQAPALDLAPCCYYRIATPRYRPLCEDAGLDLGRDELHLAVTETVTAGARDRRRADRAQAWKLAFLELRAAVGVARERPFKPVPDAWLGLGFEDWTRRLCGREAVPLPADPDWPALEQEGWRRHAEVRRLELARLAFRRPLELWLVLDRALYLERQGYRVRVGEFCARGVTPRNLLISARL